MKTLSILAFATLSIFANTGCEDTTAAADVPDDKEIIGTWQPVKGLSGGIPMRKPFLGNMTLEIVAGGQYKLTIGNKESTGSLKLVQETNPKQMTMHPHSDPDEAIRAVYELEGDSLRVCYQPRAEFYPYKLESPEGSDLYLAEYKRVAGK